MTKEAVILAGGFGTRLKSMVSDIPKPMALIRNLPFLSYLLEHLHKYKFEKVIVAAGYKYEVIESYFGTTFKKMKLVYSVEDVPLGTGGAISKAAALISSDYFFVLNGDTFFELDFDRMEEMFITSKAVNLIQKYELLTTANVAVIGDAFYRKAGDDLDRSCIRQKVRIRVRDWFDPVDVFVYRI